MVLELVRKGSVKDVYTTGFLGELLFKFTDQVSVFDLGPMPVLFSQLGRLRCSVSSLVFEFLDDQGITTHYIGRQENGVGMVVRALDIPEKSLYFEGSIGRLLPLEILGRFEVTEKFYNRIQAGHVDARVIAKLLGGKKLAIGAKLYPAFVEFSTKLQAADVYISDKEAAKVANLSAEEIVRLKDWTGIIANLLREFFARVGLDLADFKIEAGLCHDGIFILADSVSPDELRLRKDGVSFDKDPIRLDFKNRYPKWYSGLMAAKEKFPGDKSKWPEYPGIPEPHVIDDFTFGYREVTRSIGAN